MAGVTIDTNAVEVAEQIRNFAKWIPGTTVRQMDIWSRQAAKKATDGLDEPRRRRVRGRTRGGAQIVRGQPLAIITCAHQIGWWAEFGTGLYGPFKKRIVPKRRLYVNKKGMVVWRRALRYEKPGGAEFRTWSPGHPATPWFYSGIRAQLGALRERLVKAMKAEIRKAMPRVPRVRRRRGGA